MASFAFGTRQPAKKYARFAATKHDLGSPGAVDPLEPLRRAAAARGLEVVPVSAVTGEGLATLKRRLIGSLAASRAAQPLEEQG